MAGTGNVYDELRRSGWTLGEEAFAKREALSAIEGQQYSPPRTITLSSRGRCLVCGSGDETLAFARLLDRSLDVTVLLADPADVLAIGPSGRIACGTVSRIDGHLGAFRVELRDFATAGHDTRGRVVFPRPLERGCIETDIVVDLSRDGASAGCNDRDGIIRVDPADAIALAGAALAASSLVGDFEKPRYVAVEERICAHARNRITGCTNCLDVCPAGAISPAGDHITVDPGLCEGCGLCASVCPTGAISYQMPRVPDLLARAQAMLAAFAASGGRGACILLHEAEHGEPIFDAMVHDGGGLPAEVIPLATHSVMESGHDLLLGLLASGCSHVAMLIPRRHRASLSSLNHQLAIADALLAGLGSPVPRFTVIQEDDPDLVATGLREIPPSPAFPARRFGFSGSKREIERTIVAVLRESAPSPLDVVPLPRGAPYGRVLLDPARCTLCLACAAACPTGALRDTADRPALKFSEPACVQCGLCVRLCPERALALEPRYDFTAIAGVDVILKFEEPFACRSCGKPFGSRASIERVKARLTGNSHFADPRRLDLVEMCADCRVVHMLASVREPLQGKPRPRPVTSDDYLVAAADAAHKPNGE